MISEDYLQGDYKASLLSIGAVRSLTRQKNGFLFSMIPWRRKFHRVKFKTPLRLSLPFLSQFENIPTNLHIGSFPSHKTNRTRWNNSKRSYPWHCCPSLSMVNNNKSKIPLYHDAILFMSKVNHSQRKPVFKLVRFWKLPLFPISNRKTCSTWERIWPT